MIRQRLPNGLSLEDVLAAVEQDENLGFCMDCGAEVSGVEPDAHDYLCEVCGMARVFGAAEVLLMVTP